MEKERNLEKEWEEEIEDREESVGAIQVEDEGTPSSDSFTIIKQVSLFRDLSKHTPGLGFIDILLPTFSLSLKLFLSCIIRYV